MERLTLTQGQIHTNTHTDTHTEDKPTYRQTLTNLGLLASLVSILNPCLMGFGGRSVDRYGSI